MARLTAIAGALLVFAAPAHASVDRWNNEIAEASTRFGIPVDWIRRVMQAESGGRTLLAGRPVTSRAGAMGLMQLMPRTWAELRVRYKLGADPYQPRDNILAGTAYLRMMYDRFGYPGLFAAYNAGPRRYENHLAGRSRLPSETIAYLAQTAGPGQVPAFVVASGTATLPRLLSAGGAIPMAATPAPMPPALFVIDHRAAR